MVEHLPFKELVVGSNPSALTSLKLFHISSLTIYFKVVCYTYRHEN